VLAVRPLIVTGYTALHLQHLPISMKSPHGQSAL
jgi:hypothetical protein